MASYPWIVPHKRQGQDLDDFPNLKRWFEAVKARPGTQRAYKAGEAIRMPRPEDLTDESAGPGLAITVGTPHTSAMLLSQRDFVPKGW